MSTLNKPSHPLHHLEGEKISALLWRYSLPAIVAMTLMSLYHLIDSAFIGHGVGALALSALAVTFPLVNLQTALSTLVGVGCSSVVSIRMGQRRYVEAQLTAGNAISLAFLLSVVFSVLCQCWLEPLLRLFGASPLTLPYCVPFMRIMLLFSPLSYLMLTGNHLLRATGSPHKAMWSSGVSVGCNLVLAPLFIFVLHWGIRGAAIATVLSQAAALCYQLRHFFRHKELYAISPFTLRLRATVVRHIVSIGLSPFLLHICSSLVAVLVIRSLRFYGDDWAIGAYGITHRVVTLCFMVVLGLAQGMQPIIGYNYGARQWNRVKSTLLCGLSAALLFTSFVLVLIELCAPQVVRVFTTDAQLLQVSVTALRYSAVALQAVGVQCVLVNFFQSIGQSRKSICLSLTRQLLFVLPLLWLLPPIYGLNAVWLCMPIADTLACWVAIVWVWRYLSEAKHLSK